MITENRCSRSTGLSVQDQLDWMFTIKRNLEASVRSRDTDLALSTMRDLIEAGLN